MSDAGLSVYLNFSLTALRVCVGLKKLFGKAPGNPDGFPNENTEERQSRRKFISWCGCSSEHVRGVELCCAENTDWSPLRVVVE
jgi:hypothetical protein